MNDAEKIINLLDAQALGRKLRLAREKRGLTQEEAAQIINVGRTTMINIEKGDRRVRPEELVQLAIEYGRDVSEFVEEIRYEHLYTQPQFRGPEQYENEGDAEIEQWIEELKDLAYSYYEIEQLLDAPLVKKYPAEYEIGRLKAEELGESIALEERQRLGLGDKPIPVLRTLLEQEVGLRIYYLPLRPSKYSAIYVYSDHIGGCIAVNNQHPEERARMSLAHDYGHFLTSRYKPTLYNIEGYHSRRSENEKIADQFAVHFLMPTTGIMRRFTDIRKAKGKVTPYDLVEMAHYFGVSFEALSYRLEGLKLIPSGMLDHLNDEGFKVRDVQRRLGLEQLPASRQRLPLRHQLLAVEALDQGVISENQLADLFEVDLLEAREIFSTLRGQRLSFD
ncbi:MAG: ImmA/IrrE family metallo-endopeptidase [Anaerolineales bacterium]|nr:ImmA/IrrE family metallo-endopeptidase [Anaerolineales bacterium]